MSDAPGFAAVEARFAAYLRDPTGVAPPADVDPARAAVYARLVQANVEALLGQCFPVLKSVCAADHWQSLMRDFLARHRAHTPLFPRLPQELVTFLASSARTADPAWYAELADYEWLETECAQDPREIDALARVDLDADLLDDVPVLNPLARPRAYRHAVHTIAPGRIPDAPGAEPVWLVVYRRRDDRVSFLQLNAVSARLVELLGRNDGERSGRALLLQIAGELQHPRPAQLVDAGRGVLAELVARELLLGARRVFAAR
jgi:hypothetical protein